ncbi:reverse transcriptase domain-containing protein [Tanacetum coccineum]
MITKTLTFIIVRSDSSHNLLLGRTAMQEIGIVVSTVHGAIKFHTPNGVGTIFSVHNSQRLMEEEGNSTNNGQGDAKDILRVPRTLIIEEENFSTEHQLNVFNHTEPVKQKKRSLAPERSEVVRTQVEELVEAGVLREVQYQTRLPFGLKNAAATYQRLIDKVFGSQIRRNKEVNANDMVIKSDSEEEMLAHIEETLGRLQAINLNLNLRKCSFGVEEGIYSGHLITKQGIRADPSKVKAISALQPPKMVSEIQSFGKKLAALNRFLSKSAEKALPFMKTLKSCTSGKMVQWTTEANEAFRRMKEFLESLPTMVIPTKGETLTVYLAASKRNVKQKYPELEKLILALVYAARKLRRYFQAHPIQVLSDMPIKQVLAKPEKSGRVAKWAIELGEHKIEFKGRNSIKGQILADFLAETSPTEREEEKNREAKNQRIHGNYSPMGPQAPMAQEQSDVSKPRGKIIYVRIKLVANQVKGLFEARQQTIKQYLEKTIGLLSSFPNYSIKHIKREQNKKADALSKLASMTFLNLAKEVLVEVIQTKILKGRNPTKRSVKGKETTDQSSAIQDDQREAISKVVHVTMVEKARSLYSVRNSELSKHPRLSITLRQWAVLWEHRTTPKSSNRETPFSLVYGSEAVIPIEISVETKRVQDFDSKENQKRRREDLDVLEERREMAAIKEARYKQKLEGYYNKIVKPSTFKPGTYMLQLNSASKAEYQGKMGPIWEGLTE